MQFGVPEEEFRPGGNYMADSAPHGDSPNKARGAFTYLPWHFRVHKVHIARQYALIRYTALQ